MSKRTRKNLTLLQLGRNRFLQLSFLGPAVSIIGNKFLFIRVTMSASFQESYCTSQPLRLRSLAQRFVFLLLLPSRETVKATPLNIIQNLQVQRFKYIGIVTRAGSGDGLTGQAPRVTRLRERKIGFGISRNAVIILILSEGASKFHYKM